ncbi:four helix bundle protein [Candidatus Bipolaricaulota bacterium]|nr:four helix bundle protein [Candidatus Bipolaricaulota bacterium]
MARGGGSPVGFEDLEVWQQAHGLVLDIYKVTHTFPNTERFRLTDQLCRSAASIPANIAEGKGKGRDSNREFLRFLVIARGSLEETKYHLLLAKDLDYLPEADYNNLLDQYNVMGKMLNGLINKIKKEVQGSS